MDLDCKKCNGKGWVCENHRELEWDSGCCDGAGMSCKCNSAGELPFDTIIICSVDEPPTIN